MGKQLRISVLFNEPTVSSEAGLKFVAENGSLNGATTASLPEGADLSELGVLESMQQIKSALDSLGHSASVFNVNSDIQRLIEHLRNDAPDLVFNLVECLEN